MLLNIPFSIYSTFVIEEKFGFNKTTPKIFMFDMVKSLLIGAIVGGALLSVIIWFYQIAGIYFWLLAWAIVTVFMLFITMFYVKALLIKVGALLVAICSSLLNKLIKTLSSIS